MCLGIVGQVIAIKAEHPDLAEVEVAGVRRTINVGILEAEGLAPGDWILIHAGFAMEKIDETTARNQMAVLREYTGGPAALDDVNREGDTCKFLVLWRIEISLLSREVLKLVLTMPDYAGPLETQGKVVARYHIPGTHGGAWIYDVDSNEELDMLLARSPVFNFSRYEVYPLADMVPPKPRSVTN